MTVYDTATANTVEGKMVGENRPKFAGNRPFGRNRVFDDRKLLLAVANWMPLEFHLLMGSSGSARHNYPISQFFQNFNVSGFCKRIPGCNGRFGAPVCPPELQQPVGSGG